MPIAQPYHLRIIRRALGIRMPAMCLALIAAWRHGFARWLVRFRAAFCGERRSTHLGSHSCGRACGSGVALRFFPALSAPTAFRKICATSFPETCLRAAFSSSGHAAPGQYCCCGRELANALLLRCRSDVGAVKASMTCGFESGRFIPVPRHFPSMVVASLGKLPDDDRLLQGICCSAIQTAVEVDPVKVN